MDSFFRTSLIQLDPWLVGEMAARARCAPIYNCAVKVYTAFILINGSWSRFLLHAPTCIFHRVSYRIIFRLATKHIWKIKSGSLPKIAATIWDTRPFKLFSSVEISFRDVSAVSARRVRSTFSSAHVFSLTAKSVFNFSVSERLICSWEVENLISDS